jgi:flagellar hook protein FlgE
MAMMKSLSSAVSGLRAQQTAMNVIGNNVANVNTSGFRSSSTNFEDLFYDTLAGATDETNPSQVGYGTQVSNVSKNMTSGGATTTDRELDIYIDGSGYFAVSTSSTANKDKDTNPATYYTRVGNLSLVGGYLVDSNGNYVLGTTSTTGAMSPINLVGSYFTPTDSTSSVGGLIGTSSTSTVVYSDLSDISINSDGSITATYNGVSGEITYATGAYDSTSGDITNAVQIALATFVNEDGLSSVGNNYYQPTSSSGDAAYITAGDGNTTSLESSALESSNVDLASEFTNMIISQRGFQANARVITTSDTMIEELVNLKRS